MFIVLNPVTWEAVAVGVSIMTVPTGSDPLGGRVNVTAADPPKPPMIVV